MRRISLRLRFPSSSLRGALQANLRRVSALRNAIKAESPDVIIAMMATPSVLMLMASLGLRVRTFPAERVHPPTWPLPRPWGALRKLLYPLATGIIVQTEKSGQWVARECHCRRIFVIANPLMWPIPSFGTYADPHATVPPGRRVVVAAGRLDPQKGFDLLLDAWGTVAANFPDWELVILGEGPDRDLLRARAMTRPGADRVHFPGRVGNVAAWYARSDIFAMSSRFEGFPNALLEAMASGLPCISFDCDTGPQELIQDGENGLLVRQGDTRALAEGLEHLMSDAALRARLGAKATQHRRTFALSRVIARWDDVLGQG